MSKILVIVESAGKIKKISEYLGSKYIVRASFGHCMDLDPSNLSIDIENGYKPNYIITKDKHRIVNDLQNMSTQCESVILASDNDREGEAIAWSLSKLLNLINPQRIIFTEITKNAIDNAIKNPKEINMNIVYAQQARRILDRLVGYKISPILQNNLNDTNAKSAGRVQSVLVKIINDKEHEINNYESISTLKTTCELKIKNDKILCTLMKKNNLDFYIFNSLEDAKIFMKLFDKKTIFKITDIQNKISIRNPPPPFITSSLQQESYTKLKFNVKKTMDIAQQLYENGLITYMRTDYQNLSDEIINNCKKYIISNYGKEYSRPFNYTSSKNSQQAHEAIRPTNINILEDTIIDNNQKKLYNLIWKKTIACQMSPAQINIQTILIENIFSDIKIINNDFLWISKYENIIFDGFLKVYSTDLTDSTDSTEEKICKKSTCIKLNQDDILKFNKMKINEEFKNLPLRFNEANLVKFLEKNNIGRPSTYSSLINKILERNYVEIKDIPGIKKESNILELNKQFNITETKNEIIIGKENKKIVPTDLGIKITEFLENNFTELMQINFTSEFETYLDKIADNKATLYNVLNIFYKKFNPIVEKLFIKKNIKEDKLLGIDPIKNIEIFIGSGKYGPYIKYLNDKEKYIYASIESTDISLDDALKLMSFPKIIGKYNKKNVELAKGKYGVYIKYNKQNFSIPKNIDNDTLKLEDAIKIINNKKLAT